MQSLLYAVGLGAGSMPVAAAVNWVLKDGLGQLGGIAFASAVNNQFDRDVKLWRLRSALVLDVATLLEVCTPLVPSLFLPLAAIANAGKNVAWLSASATRAGLHLALTAQGNLADVTAKSGAQSITASLVGTGLGIALSPLVGADPWYILPVFASLSAIHIASVYQAVRSIAVPTLTADRAQRLARAFSDQWSEMQRSTHRGPSAISLPSPERVRHEESIAGPGGVHLWRGAPELGPLRLLVSVPLSSLHRAGEVIPTAARHCSDGGGGTYWAFIDGAGSAADDDARVVLLMANGALWQAVLRGVLECALLNNAVQRSKEKNNWPLSWDSVRALEVEAADRAQAMGGDFLWALEEAGWWVGQPLVERDVARRISVE